MDAHFGITNKKQLVDEENKMSFELLPIVGAVASLGALSTSIFLTIKSGLVKEVETKYLLKKSSIRNHSLERAIANEAIFRLSSYVQSLEPDYIVGVNRGGTMVGAFISLGLGIKSKNFVKCLVSRKGKYKATCHIGHMHGTVVVIDDVSRSGKTIEEAIKEIKAKNPNIEDIYSAVLVTTLDDLKRPKYKSLNYYSYATLDDEIFLPWTPRIKNIDNKEKVRLKLFKEIRKKPRSKIAQDISSALYEPN